MNKETLKKLEFDKIQQQLADLTLFEGGYRLAVQVEPSQDYQVVCRRLMRLRRPWNSALWRTGLFGGIETDRSGPVQSACHGF